MYPQPFKRPGYKHYYYRITDPDTKKRILRSTGTEKKRLAHEVIKQYIDDLKRYTGKEIFTLSEFLQPWVNGVTNPRYERYQLEGKQYGLRQVQDIARLMEKYVLPHPISNKQIYLISRGDALDFRKNLSAGVLKEKPRTVNRVISALRSVYSETLHRGEIVTNTFAGIGEIKYQQKVKEILNPEEIKNLLKKEYFPSTTAYQVFSIAAYTGMRMSEILALHWDQYDDGILTIDRAWKTEHELGSPKWGKTRRYPLSDLAIACLPEKECDLIFHRNGIRLGNTWWIRNFIAALDNSDIEKSITPHCLRHSLNSNLLIAGVSPFLIQHYLGWSNNSSLTKVQEGYTHIEPKNLQPVADMIDSLYTVSERNNIIQFRKIE